MEKEGLEELDDLIQICYSQQKPSVVHLRYQKVGSVGELTLSIVVESQLYQWKSMGKSSFDSLYVRKTDQTLLVDDDHNRTILFMQNQIYWNSDPKSLFSHWLSDQFVRGHIDTTLILPDKTCRVCDSVT
ncbi:hypothetical protein [Absidia glauca]|uniref:Uncharacterized protein n=1 Tax=Absidia glauca TaxID=4829 RepID=A0A168KZH1_ABSGL|nr:hypothetical protein [Absidia glauca]